MNSNPAAGLRLGQRMRMSQGLSIVNGYDKKIRPHIDYDQSPLHGDDQLNNLIYYYKNTMKNETTKPLSNSFGDIKPCVCIRNDQQTPFLQGFNQIVAEYLTQLKQQNEIDSNRKYVLRPYKIVISRNPSDKYSQIAKASTKALLNALYVTYDNKIKAYNSRFSQWQSGAYPNVDIQTPEWKVIHPLRYVRAAVKAALGPNQRQNTIFENSHNLQPKSAVAAEMILFIANSVELMQQIREGQVGSTVLAVQPQLGPISLLIHPLMTAIHGNFRRENTQKKKQPMWEQLRAELLPMLNCAKSDTSYNYSRVAFINLDGFQCESNFEMARNFYHKLMYVTFPKDMMPQGPSRRVYQGRLFKKLMYRYAQHSYYKHEPDATVSTEKVSMDPEDYFLNGPFWDVNRDNDSINNRIYPFPIKLKALQERFTDSLEGSYQVLEHESYFVDLVMRQFVLPEIEKFSPKLILISYSGHIRILPHHMKRILKELVKICNYRLIFFPNYSSSAYQKHDLQTTDEDGMQCQYDNPIDEPHQMKLFSPSPQIIRSNGECLEPPLPDDFLDRINDVLKLGSGYEDLSKSPDEITPADKYNSHFLLKYLGDLMRVIGKQYPAIEAIRMRDDELTNLQTHFEEQIAVNAEKTPIPDFSRDLCVVAEGLINNHFEPQTLQIASRYGLDIEAYKPLAIEVRNYINSQILSLIGTQAGINGLSQKLQAVRQRKFKQFTTKLMDTHLFKLSTTAHQAREYVYVRTTPMYAEYSQTIDDAADARGLFQVTFIGPDRKQLRLPSFSRVIYQSDQHKAEAKRIPIIVNNHLGLRGGFKDYYGQLDITPSENPKRVEVKKVALTPIKFFDEETMEPQFSFSVRSSWSFAETSSHLLLLWPIQYDHLRSLFHQFLNRGYYPYCSNQLYAAARTNPSTFYRIVIASQLPIEPRTNVSLYRLKDSLFIFGGYYPKERSSVKTQDQHDIIRFDMRQFQQADCKEIIFESCRSRLYSLESLNNQLNEGKPNNCFVRPRAEIEFLDVQDLIAPQQTCNFNFPTNLKVVLALPGYGNNKGTSMLTNFYYEIVFNMATQSIISVSKCLIYQKCVPINTRFPTINPGKNACCSLNEAKQMEPRKTSRPGSWALIKVSYQLVPISTSNTPNPLQGPKSQLVVHSNPINRPFKTYHQHCHLLNGFEIQYKFKHVLILPLPHYGFGLPQQTGRIVNETQTQTSNPSNQLFLKRIPNKAECIQIGFENVRSFQALLALNLDQHIANSLGSQRNMQLSAANVNSVDFSGSLIVTILKYDTLHGRRYVFADVDAALSPTVSMMLSGGGLRNPSTELGPTLLLEESHLLSAQSSGYHALIACNRNTFLLAHGLQVFADLGFMLEQKVLKRRKARNQIGQAKVEYSRHGLELLETAILQVLIQSGIQTQQLPGGLCWDGCLSYFVRQGSKVKGVDLVWSNDIQMFMKVRGSTAVIPAGYLLSQSLELNIANEKYKWMPNTVQRIFVKYEEPISNKQSYTEQLLALCLDPSTGITDLCGLLNQAIVLKSTNGSITIECGSGDSKIWVIVSEEKKQTLPGGDQLNKGMEPVWGSDVTMIIQPKPSRQTQQMEFVQSLYKAREGYCNLIE